MDSPTEVQYSQRATCINPLTPVIRIIHARLNTAAERPLTLLVMTLAYRDDRTRGFAVVAREGSSRSTVFHRLHCTCKLYKISDHRVRPSGSAVFEHRVARCSLSWAIEHRWPPEISAKTPIAVVIFSEYVKVNRGDGCSNEGSALAVLYHTFTIIHC